MIFFATTHRPRFYILCICICIFVSQILFAHGKSDVQKIVLWKGVTGMKYQNTQLHLYIPEESIKTDTAVIICPGGSYHHLDMKGEGVTTARWFQSIGVTACILKYRVSREGYHYPAMLQDFQRAIQFVREHATDYHINPNKVGAIGYSAGGHMVLMGAVYGNSDNELEVLGITTNVSLKPDFIMPIYPVVSMDDEIAHSWSRWSLLGYNQSVKLKNKLSMEKHITSDICPVFNIVAKDDQTVDYRNSLVLQDALEKAGVEHYFKLYDVGGHGFGMKDNEFMRCNHWNQDLLQWLQHIKML